jgi:thiol-disulfide isomerase/thioredoxin
VAALPWFEPGQDDPAVGLLAPPVTGASFDGTPVSIEADGRAKMLVFLAHWCPHCQDEVPEVQRWLDEGGLPETIDLISVATAIDETRPNYPPDAWLEREGWNAPVIVDDEGQVAQQYGLSAFPFWVIVDADGRVVGRATGRLPVEQLDQIVTWLTEQELDATEGEDVDG